MNDLKSRILEKFGEPTIGNLATITADGKPWVRYIVVAADADLNIWFSTHRGSRKVKQIQDKADVHLNTGVTTMDSAESYIQVEGKAEILTDAETKRAMWNDMLKTYFSGPDDPDFCVGKITPSRIELWGMTPGQECEVWES